MKNIYHVSVSNRGELTMPNLITSTVDFDFSVSIESVLFMFNSAVVQVNE
jgi:hypothetical protein